MNQPASLGRLTVASALHRFIHDEALPGTGIDAAQFWQGLSDILSQFMPRNAAARSRSRPWTPTTSATAT